MTAPTPTASPKLKVLIVEDDLSILMGLSMNLRYEGYEVLQAQDGESGLQMAMDAQPDVVVLDVMLPRMNGFEVCKENPAARADRWRW